jgi:hypothetical protein
VESDNLFFNQKRTCKQLVETISKTFNIPLSTLHAWHGKKQLKVIKGVLLGTKAEDGGNANKTLRIISLFDNSKIYIEEVKEGEAPKWPDEFEIETHRINILFSNPYT